MKFIIDNIVLIVLAISSGAALLFLSLQNRGAKATPIAATQLMNRGKTLVLDVRTSTEFATGHLRDAKNIALGDLAKRIGELEKFKSTQVIVVCRSGNLSSRATLLLQRAGFANVVSLEGGLTAWQAAGLPTTK